MRLAAGNSQFARALEVLKEQQLSSLPAPTDMPAGLSDPQKSAIDQARKLFEAGRRAVSICVEQLEPGNTVAALGLGRAWIALERAGQGGGAVEQGGDKTGPGPTVIRYFLAQLYLNQQQWEDANECLSRPGKRY